MHVTTPLFTHIAVYFTPFLFFTCGLALVTHTCGARDRMLRDAQKLSHLTGSSGTRIERVRCEAQLYKAGGSTFLKGVAI